MIYVLEKTDYSELRGLLPYETIVQAVAGNYDAMETVLAHFERQINFLSRRLFCDDDGNPFYGTDMDIKDRLTSKLMQAVILFKIDYSKPKGINE